MNAKRTWQLMRCEIKSNIKAYGLMMAIVMGPFVFGWISGIKFDDALLPGVGAGWMLGALMVVLSPILLYKNVYHPQRGISYLMRPTHIQEKYLSMWLQTVILTPVLLFVWAFLLSLISLFFSSSVQFAEFWQDLWVNFSFEWNGAWLKGLEILILSVFLPQAAIMCGNFIFKKNKLFKTLTLAIALSLFWGLFADSINIKQYFIDSFGEEVWATFTFVMGVLAIWFLYVCSFLGLKTRQI